MSPRWEVPAPGPVPGRRGRPGARLAVAVCVLAVLLGGCSELLVDPAPPAPALALAFTVGLGPVAAPAEVAASLGAAFDKADQVRVRIKRGEATILDRTLDFRPTSAETRVRIELDLEEDRETLDVQVELRAASHPIFQGGGAVAVEAGTTTEALIALEPIPAGVRVPESVPDLESIGQTVQLTGEVVFATGDPIPGLSLAWSTLDPQIVTVTPGGVVTARAEGSARVVGGFGDFSGTVTVGVRQRVAAVQIEPTSLTLALGQTRQFTATLRDARGNPITGRSIAWTSLATAVATVDGNGLVRAVGTGQATIRATSEEVVGQAQVTVVGLAPSAATEPPSAVSGSGATLRGTVNPNGEATQVWFEWGTATNLGSATPRQSIGSGTTATGVSAAASGLQPATTYFYRVAAENARGTTYGAIVQFQTQQVAPAAPSSLAATAASTSQINLAWTDNSTNEDGFRIERCTGASCTNFAQIATVGANATSYQNTGLAAGTTYRYRVRAFNAAGNSAYSNIAAATTDPTLGPMLFTSGTTGNNEIWLRSANGAELVQLTATGAGTSNWDAEWSPDGTRIVFSSYRNGLNDHVWVMNADGSNPRALTTNAVQNVFPSWSPDGRQIVFSSGTAAGREIWVMNEDGSSPVQLTRSGAEDSQADWSPDGRQIVFFSARTGTWQIWVMNADGSNQTRLTYSGAYDFFPAWSPDGTRIAFVSNRDGNYEIYVMDADGTNPVRLTHTPGTELQPSWTPDGSNIVFMSDRDGKSEIYIMGADGLNQTPLTTTGSNQFPHVRP
jgi:Tol biopolymer transport system component